MKIMKKNKGLMIPTLILTLVALMAFPLTASASTSYLNEINSQETNSLNVVEFKSNEEMQDFVQKLDQHNERVQKKWQEVLSKADEVSPILPINQEVNQVLPTLEMEQLSMARANTSYYSETAEFNRKWYEWPSYNYFRGYLNLRGETVTDSSTRFVNYTGVYLKSADTKNKVEDFTYQIAASDAHRTYVVKTDAFVTVKVSDGNSKRYPLYLCVEFYSTGGSYVYE